MSIVERMKSMVTKQKPLGRGFHTYRDEGPDGSILRMHLRVEEGGTGVLVINASKVLHLNQTGAEFAKLMFDGLDEDSVAKAVKSRYRVSLDKAKADYKEFRDQILCIATQDLCPVESFEFGRLEPFSMPVSAPYRMDLALTHRCDLDCGHCYAGGPREMKELGTEEWKEVQDKLFEIGIPHICYTGGEATLREDLVELIEHAEDLGLVTGLLTNGCRLSDRAYVDRLVQAGLDHVQITIESGDPEVHDSMVRAKGHERTVAGIKNCLEAGLYTVTNTTITQKNKHTLIDTVKFLHDLGIKRFAMNGIIHAGRGEGSPDALPPEELSGLLETVNDAAAGLDMEIIWYTPTRYCEFDPVEHGLGMKRCTAGHYNMCVEPDGSVLPCQSYFEPVGNLLADDWDAIWNNKLLKDLRERAWVDAECRDCDELALCGGGCPLEKDGKGPLCADSLSNF